MVFVGRIDVRLTEEDLKELAYLKQVFKLSTDVEVMRVALRTCYVEMKLSEK